MNKSLSSNKLRILIDIGHPAHVHIFKNAAKEFESRGYRVLWTARNREVVVDLLKQYGFDFKILTRPKHGFLKALGELIEHDLKMLSTVLKYKPHLMMGTSIGITHVGRLLKIPSLFFSEDDKSVQKHIVLLAYPFCNFIITPDCLASENWGKKHILHRSYHELAYLHPDNFCPDSNVLDMLNQKSEDRFFILRFVSFQARHDVREEGIPHETKKYLIQFLSEFGSVYITSERPLPKEFEKFRFPLHPSLIHDALSFATIFIGDSQTMTAEAAVLGVPSIRYNSFVGRLTYLEELEHKYQLTFGYRPGQEEEMLKKIKELLKTKNLREEWFKRRDSMLKEKINLTKWTVDFVEKIALKEKIWNN